MQQQRHSNLLLLNYGSSTKGLKKKKNKKQDGNSAKTKFWTKLQAGLGTGKINLSYLSPSSSVLEETRQCDFLCPKVHVVSFL